jgi:predicted nucleotidyltransferase
MNIKNTILHHLKELHLLSRTEFVVLYGSVQRKKKTPLSDIDVCISLKAPAKERLRMRIKLFGRLPSAYDLQIFEDLPLYLKKSIISGTFLYCRDKQKTVQRALDVIREYDDFEPIYSYYIARDKSKVRL